MSRGTLFQASELDSRLRVLDIDEGIRVEAHPAEGGAINKLFINRRASGEFVLQHGHHFSYTLDPEEVRRTIKATFPEGRITFWAY